MQKADFSVKFEVSQRQQLASERTPLTLFAPAPSTISFVPLTRNLSLADPSPYPVRGWTGLSEATATRFSVLRKAREGVLRTGCHLKMRRIPQKPVLSTEYLFRTREGGFRYRISLPYRRSLFFTPNASENAFGTPGACFEHGTHIPYPRRPSPVPNATNTTQSHPTAQTTASSTPSLQPCPHYGYPPHGSRLGQETTVLRKNLCNFFKNLRELSRSFFIFVLNKYRNTQCKLFTTNTTNSWNLPR